MALHWILSSRSVSFFSFPGKPRIGRGTPGDILPVLSEEESYLPQLAADTSQNVTHDTVGLLWHECCLISILISSRTYEAISTSTCGASSVKLLSRWPDTNACGYMRLFLCIRKVCHFFLLTAWGFCHPISSNCWSLTGWQHDLLVDQLFLSFVLSPNPEIMLDLLTSSLKRCWSWCSSLVSGLQLDFTSLITTIWAHLSDFSIHSLSAHPAHM